MNGAERRIVSQQHDEPLDLPPVAKADMIAQIPAAVGASRRFITGIVAKERHQLGGIVIALRFERYGMFIAYPPKVPTRKCDISFNSRAIFPLSRYRAGSDGEPRVSHVPGWHSHPVTGQARAETRQRESRWPWPPGRGKGSMMTTGKKNPTGAGAVLALTILGGTIIGGLIGQPSAGLLAGTALGILIAVLLWWRESGK